MVPLELRSSGPLRVLCLGAHCDDIEIGCGGTLIRLSRTQDVELRWVVLSSTPTREAETRAAAASLFDGRIKVDLTVHSFRDGYLPACAAEVKETIEALKDEGSPDLIFTTHIGDAHQDHRMLAELTWNTFRDHTILEYEVPKYDGDLGRPNVYVPLHRDEVQRKIDVLHASFPSQRSRQWFDDETFRGLLRLRGVECNAPDRYAEAFHGRKLVMGSREDR
jgi:LmbE family N-acetylglucosaminyl deacetylase